MKINKLLLPILTGFLLCGCGSNKSEDMYSIEQDGTVLDLANAEQANLLATKAKGMMDAATGADNIGLHLVLENGQFKYDKNIDADYGFGEVEFNSTTATKIDAEGSGKLHIVANGLQSATKFSELGAYVGIKDANLKFDYFSLDKQTGIYEDENRSEGSFDASNVNFEAYLKDSKVYADLSNEAFLFAANEFLTAIGTIKPESPESSYDSSSESTVSSEETNYLKEMLITMLGSLKPIILLDATNVDPFTYPLIGDDIKSITNSIDVATMASMIATYADFAKEILTVNVYKDGSVGLFIDVTKEKIVNIFKKILILSLGEDVTSYTSEQLEEMLPEELDFIKTCNVKIAIVINANGSLRRIGIDVDFYYDAITHNLTGAMIRNDTTTEATLKLKSYIKMDYNETIEYPDLSTFIPSQFGYTFGEDL